jgi:nucleoside-diphosphate-sugar epimerase
MSSGKSVFIVGPGFIGWNVLDNLVNEGYSVTALVRRPEHANDIRNSGAKTVQGTLNDHNLIADQASRHHVCDDDDDR